jgi:hypothetical protein
MPAIWKMFEKLYRNSRAGHEGLPSIALAPIIVNVATNISIADHEAARSPRPTSAEEE